MMVQNMQNLQQQGVHNPFVATLNNMSTERLTKLMDSLDEKSKQDIDRRLETWTPIVFGEVADHIRAGLEELATSSELMQATMKFYFTERYYEETGGRHNLDKFRKDISDALTRQSFLAGQAAAAGAMAG